MVSFDNAKYFQSSTFLLRINGYPVVKSIAHKKPKREEQVKMVMASVLLSPCQ